MLLPSSESVSATTEVANPRTFLTLKSKQIFMCCGQVSIARFRYLHLLIEIPETEQAKIEKMNSCFPCKNQFLQNPAEDHLTNSTTMKLVFAAPKEIMWPFCQVFVLVTGICPKTHYPQADEQTTGKMS
jgi:hypothetical protein